MPPSTRDSASEVGASGRWRRAPKRILGVAERLFMGRGYERTTMADIVAGLGGLTKGAIYHHFKSEEDIFEAVFERASRPVVARD